MKKEDLLKKAQEYGVTLTDGEAENILSLLKEATALSDDAMEHVSAGVQISAYDVFSNLLSGDLTDGAINACFFSEKDKEALTKKLREDANFKELMKNVY